MKQIRHLIKDNWALKPVWHKIDDYIKQGKRKEARDMLDQNFWYYYAIEDNPWLGKDSAIEKNKMYDSWHRRLAYKLKVVKEECFNARAKKRAEKMRAIKEKRKMDKGGF